MNLNGLSHRRFACLLLAVLAALPGCDRSPQARGSAAEPPSSPKDAPLWAESRPASASAPSPVASSAVARPNIVLILCDDLRYDTFGFAGHPVVKTPAIDRLAAEGTVFDRAFVTTSFCCPTRATLLTGLYAHRSGVSINGQDLDYQKHRILPQYLKDAGYETALIGKWHLGENGHPRPGFDKWISFECSSGQGDYVDCEMFVGDEKQQTRGHNTDVLRDFAVEWLAQRTDRPFFLMLSLKSPHQPYIVPERHEGLYSDAEIRPPVSYSDPRDPLPISSRPNTNVVTRLVEGELAADKVVEIIRGYYRMIPAIDETVAAVRLALEKSGQIDRTVILFTSDNGLLLGEHGIVRKGLAYEPSIRVPLVARGPGIPAGRRIAQHVLDNDLPATILDFAAVTAPGECQGRSWRPLLAGSAGNWRSDWLYMAPWRDTGRCKLMAVRSEKWKFVHYTERSIAEELFDLEADPDERTNLVDDPEQAERVAASQRRLKELMAELGVNPRWYDPPRGDGR